jgi:hypothetical protein
MYSVESNISLLGFAIYLFPTSITPSTIHQWRKPLGPGVLLLRVVIKERRREAFLICTAQTHNRTQMAGHAVLNTKRASGTHERKIILASRRPTNTHSNRKNSHSSLGFFPACIVFFRRGTPKIRFFMLLSLYLSCMERRI